MDPVDYQPRVELLHQKYERIKQNEVRYESINLDDAALVIVAYGSAFRSAMTAMKMAREAGMKVGIFRPITLFPFPVKPLFDLSRKVKRFLVAELSLGQLMEDVRLSLGADAQVELVNQFAGVPISADEILEAIEKITK
jgi:2-oxoglutarate ferredoxin oxidoreductase subunit alpha